MEQYGGRAIVRGPVSAVLEGAHHPHAAAIFEFPTREAALRCYDSEEYAPLKALRHSGSASQPYIIGD